MQRYTRDTRSSEPTAATAGRRPGDRQTGATREPQRGVTGSSGAGCPASRPTAPTVCPNLAASRPTAARTTTTTSATQGESASLLSRHAPVFLGS